MLVEFYYYFSTFLKCCQSNDRKKAFFTINQLYFCIDSVIFTKFSRGTCFSTNGMVYYKSSMRSFSDAIPTVWRRIEVVVTSLTRNQVVRKGTWVRIPPSPPTKFNPAAYPAAGFLVCNIFIILVGFIAY